MADAEPVGDWNSKAEYEQPVVVSTVEDATANFGGIGSAVLTGKSTRGRADKNARPQRKLPPMPPDSDDDMYEPIGVGSFDTNDDTYEVPEDPRSRLETMRRPTEGDTDPNSRNRSKTLFRDQTVSPRNRAETLMRPDGEDDEENFDGFGDFGSPGSAITIQNKPERRAAPPPPPKESFGGFDDDGEDETAFDGFGSDTENLSRNAGGYVPAHPHPPLVFV